MIETARQAAQLLRGEHQLLNSTLHLQLEDFCLALRSNSRDFLQMMSRYFSHCLAEHCTADATVEAYDAAVQRLDIEWRDWAREPGKSGRKDSYHELDDGRLLNKVRTGMLFLQSEPCRIALGPCRQLDNQVINFINSQYMNRLQQQGWLICHAAGLELNGAGLGIAGLSGGGKSTLMLALMDNSQVNYVTNDRLFIKRDMSLIKARGIPKLPRINPGTIVHNPALHSLIEPAQRARLLELPGRELWHLEDKHDVIISDVYGPGRMRNSVPLDVFVILNWSHDSTEDTQLKTVQMEQRSDLLPAIMKSPGPFYQFADGSFYQDNTPLDNSSYLETLRGVTILEATGRINIPAIQQAIEQYVNAGG